MQTITITADDNFDPTDDGGELRILASGTEVVVIDGIAHKIEFIAPCSYCDGYGHGSDPDAFPGCPAYWKG